MVTEEALSVAERRIFLFIVLMAVVPGGLVLFFNSTSFFQMFDDPSKRSSVLAFISFWFAAVAALLAGRGVLRDSGRGQGDSEYVRRLAIRDYHEGGVFLFLGAVAAALAMSDRNYPFAVFQSAVVLGVFTHTCFVWSVLIKDKEGATARSGWGRFRIYGMIFQWLSVVILILVYNALPVDKVNQDEQNSPRLVASTS